MITEITTGKYKIIESNTIYLFDAYSDLRLHFDTQDDELEFDVKFTFNFDEKTKDSNVEEYASENEISFIFTNYDNPFGSGTSKPIEIATVNDKKLYMCIWIYGIGKKQNRAVARKVEYTIFMER